MAVRSPTLATGEAVNPSGTFGGPGGGPAEHEYRRQRGNEASNYHHQ